MFLIPLARMLGIALVLLLILSLAHNWPATRWAHRLWQRYGSYVRWYVTSAPATFIYLAILLVTTWVLLGMPEHFRSMFLAAQSTNLQHLTSNPVRVLVRSAFFVTDQEFLVWTVLFAMLLAPAERWLGSARMIGVFAVGHVLATLVAALDVWIHIRYFGGSASLWTVEDTGASYGFVALTGIMFYRLRGWSRWTIGAVLAAIIVYGAMEGHGFTARGHAVAALVGLALYPVARLEAVQVRRGPADQLTQLWRRATADGPAVLAR